MKHNIIEIKVHIEYCRELDDKVKEEIRQLLLFSEKNFDHACKVKNTVQVVEQEG